VSKNSISFKQAAAITIRALIWAETSGEEEHRATLDGTINPRLPELDKSGRLALLRLLEANHQALEEQRARIEAAWNSIGIHSEAAGRVTILTTTDRFGIEKSRMEVDRYAYSEFMAQLRNDTDE
jgi:hypothetical protein